MRGLIYATLISSCALLAAIRPLAAGIISQTWHQAEHKLVVGVGRLIGDNQESNEELTKFLGPDASKNVIVEYGAPWCPHCKKMQPVVDTLSKTYIVYQVNVDNQRPLAKEQKAHLLPTFVVYDNGKEVARYVGEQSAETLTSGVKTKEQQNPQPTPTPTPPDYNITHDRNNR